MTSSGAREIKFRAWDKGRKQWRKGFALDELGDQYSWQKVHPPDHHAYVKQASNFLTVMQYTGLKDKNGVEIYEGDILQLKNTKGQVSNHQEVFWNDEAACWGWRTANEDSWPDSFSGFYDDYEVVGNIYENGDLLK